MASGVDPKEWECAPGFFVDLMLAAAPERSGEIETIVTDKGIVFVPDYDNDHIHFCADSTTAEVIVGVRCLGRLWAHAFSYVRFYDIITEAANEDPDIRSMSLLDTPEARQACDMLEWAVNEEINVTVSADWNLTYVPSQTPSSAPIPFDPAEDDLHHRLATHLALLGVGYILFHEVAHIVLGHTKSLGAWSVQQEKEADRWAAVLMVDGVVAGTPGRKKRFLAMAIALLWLVQREVYFERAGSRTHPPAYDRLYQVLDQFVDTDDKGRNGEENYVWSFVQLVLCLHMQHKGIALDYTRPFDDFKEWMNYALDVLSRSS